MKFIGGIALIIGGTIFVIFPRWGPLICAGLLVLLGLVLLMPRN